MLIRCITWKLRYYPKITYRGYYQKKFYILFLTDRNHDLIWRYMAGKIMQLSKSLAYQRIE